MDVSRKREVEKIRVSEKIYLDVLRYLMDKYGSINRHIYKLLDEALERYLAKRMSNPQLPSGFTSRHYVHRFGKFAQVLTTLKPEIKRMLDEYVNELSKRYGVRYGLKRAIVEEALTEYLKGEA